MNIFVTNACPIISTQEHCNVHLRKMIVEVAQMLSTAHSLLDGSSVWYKPTDDPSVFNLDSQHICQLRMGGTPSKGSV